MPSPNLTRRALLAGAGTAVASAALAIPYVNAAHADEVCSIKLPEPRDGVARIEQLIRRHERIWLALERSCDAADYARRHELDDGSEQQWERLCSAETSALHALMREAPLNHAASNRKGTYLLTTIGGGGRWEPDHENVVSLIQSLL